MRYVDQMIALGRLEANWDSYGAVVIDPKCISKAGELAYALPGTWTMVPCSDGSVQLEQRADGFEIEVLVCRRNE